MKTIPQTLNSISSFCKSWTVQYN